MSANYDEKMVERLAWSIYESLDGDLDIICVRPIARAVLTALTRDYAIVAKATIEQVKDALSDFLWIYVDVSREEQLASCDKARSAYVALGGVIPETTGDEEDEPDGV